MSRSSNSVAPAPAADPVKAEISSTEQPQADATPVVTDCHTSETVDTNREVSYSGTHHFGGDELGASHGRLAGQRTSDAMGTHINLASMVGDSDATPVDGMLPPPPVQAHVVHEGGGGEAVRESIAMPRSETVVGHEIGRGAELSTISHGDTGMSLYDLNAPHNHNPFEDYPAAPALAVPAITPNASQNSMSNTHSALIHVVNAEELEPAQSSPGDSLTSPAPVTEPTPAAATALDPALDVPAVMRELHFQLIPYVSPGQPPNPTVDCMERKIREGEIVRIGRKVIKNGQEQLLEGQKDSPLNVWYQSKVVSRSHAEIWIQDGQLFVKDSGSSSGTFLNKLRLSPSGKESKPTPIRENDLLVFGVDYKGKTDGDDFYRCVSVRIGFYDNTWIKQLRKKANPEKFQKALKSLLNASNPYSAHQEDDDGSSPEDCCICIGEILPLQAIFISPCSHCYHYKCVQSILMQSQMFQCPMCRQVANLAASVSAESLEGNARPFTSDSKHKEEESGAHARGETAVPPDEGVGGGGAPGMPHLNTATAASGSSRGANSPSPSSAGSHKSFWGKSKDGRPGSGKNFGGLFKKKHD